VTSTLRRREALHDAFVAAIAQWMRDGIPKNRRSWLISTGRFKAIDPYVIAPDLMRRCLSLEYDSINQTGVTL
jgi:predicted RNA polymerase sigma factor